MLLVLILLVSLATAGNPMARAVQRLTTKNNAHAPFVPRPTLLKHAAQKKIATAAKKVTAVDAHKKVAAPTAAVKEHPVKKDTIRSQLMRLPAQMMKHYSFVPRETLKKKVAARK